MLDDAPPLSDANLWVMVSVSPATHVYLVWSGAKTWLAGLRRP